MSRFKFGHKEIHEYMKSAAIRSDVCESVSE